MELREEISHLEKKFLSLENKLMLQTQLNVELVREIKKMGDKEP